VLASLSPLDSSRFCRIKAAASLLLQPNFLLTPLPPKVVDGFVGRRLSGGAFAPFTGDHEWVDGTTGAWMALHVITAMCVTLFLPRLTKAFPSALAGILTPTIVEWALVRQVGHSTTVIEDVSSVAGSFPIPVWFDDDYNMPTFNGTMIGKVWVTSVLVACIGMLEAQMTLSVIDDMTATKGNRNQECIGQGVGNFVSGV
jgi:SulP family sulfate permease